MKVTGADELFQTLDSLQRRTGRIVARAVGKTASQSARSIRGRITNRNVAATIGSRLTKTSGDSVDAKIGAGVAKRVATSTKNRSGRSGVGIDARNVHWWFLGTANRYTGTKRSATGRKDTGSRKRFTGKMPAQERPISVLFNQNGTVRVLRTWLDVGIKKELT
jgi:hypothetical protein